MEDFKVKHLPLSQGGTYIGLISEKELLALPDLSVEIGPFILSAPCVRSDSSLHEALALITRYRLTLLPVVGSEKSYEGVVTRDRLVDILADLCNADSAGSIIVIELAPQAYSLTDIARIIESNNAHVLNLLSYTDKDTGRIHLIIKIDLEDASPVLRSLERFNYTVLYYAMENGVVDDLLQRRIEELVRYMNI